MGTIELEAIAHHGHYDRHGTRHNHAPGERYTVDDDGAGYTHMAAAYIMQGLVKRIEPKPTPKKAATK